MEIKISLNDLKYRYDVYQMFNIYYPLEEIKFEDEGIMNLTLQKFASILYLDLRGIV